MNLNANTLPLVKIQSMKKYIHILLISSFLAACSNGEKQPINHLSSQDEAFDKFKATFIDELWKTHPIWASYQGMHEYDDQLPMLDDSRRMLMEDFWLQAYQGIDTFELERLSVANQIDHQLIQNQISSYKFYANEYQSINWDPSSYNLGGAFFQVLNYTDLALEDRLNLIFEKLQSVEGYYDVAKANLKTTTEVHAKLALQQIEGSKAIFGKTLTDSILKADFDEAFKVEFKNMQQIALEAIDAYLDYLEFEFIPSQESDFKDFRIGESLFESKFQYDIQSSYSAKEVYDFALNEKEILHKKMTAVAERLWPKYFEDETPPSDHLVMIDQLIEVISKMHVHRDSFVVSIRKQIPELESFVRKHDLLTLDPDKPLIVRETPEYMRGFAGASISAPGPYDAESETFYNVTPLDHYNEVEAESYLREYNDYTLQILNIHEAIPGHYTQLVYSNQSPSIIKSVFSNGAMVEGWAVYSELMMMENGYAQGSDEMDLMYFKWNLRTVCNAILDYGIHVLDMNEEEAMDLLMNQAFQEQSEAEGKWRRARLSQVQLSSYFTGFYEIRALREEIKQLMGDEFDLKSFHEEFLSYGSAPVKYIRAMMLKNIEEKASLS